MLPCRLPGIAIECGRPLQPALKKIPEKAGTEPKKEKEKEKRGSLTAEQFKQQGRRGSLRPGERLVTPSTGGAKVAPSPH